PEVVLTRRLVAFLRARELVCGRMKVVGVRGAAHCFGGRRIVPRQRIEKFFAAAIVQALAGDERVARERSACVLAALAQERVAQDEQVLCAALDAALTAAEKLSQKRRGAHARQPPRSSLRRPCAR